jgi:hypothetical protein
MLHDPLWAKFCVYPLAIGLKDSHKTYPIKNTQLWEFSCSMCSFLVQSYGIHQEGMHLTLIMA